MLFGLLDSSWERGPVASPQTSGRRGLLFAVGLPQPLAVAVVFSVRLDSFPRMESSSQRLVTQYERGSGRRGESLEGGASLSLSPA